MNPEPASLQEPELLWSYLSCEVYFSRPYFHEARALIIRVFDSSHTSRSNKPARRVSADRWLPYESFVCHQRRGTWNRSRFSFAFGSVADNKRTQSSPSAPRSVGLRHNCTSLADEPVVLFFSICSQHGRRRRAFICRLVPVRPVAFTGVTSSCVGPSVRARLCGGGGQDPANTESTVLSGTVDEFHHLAR